MPPATYAVNLFRSPACCASPFLSSACPCPCRRALVYSGQLSGPNRTLLCWSHRWGPRRLAGGPPCTQGCTFFCTTELHFATHEPIPPISVWSRSFPFKTMCFFFFARFHFVSVSFKCFQLSFVKLIHSSSPLVFAMVCACVEGRWGSHIL